MGRGRQKAKHTKVARELKYFSPDTDLTALERELASTPGDADYEALAAKYADFDDQDDTEIDSDEDATTR